MVVHSILQKTKELGEFHRLRLCHADTGISRPPELTNLHLISFWVCPCRSFFYSCSTCAHMHTARTLQHMRWSLVQKPSVHYFYVITVVNWHPFPTQQVAAIVAACCVSVFWQWYNWNDSSMCCLTLAACHTMCVLRFKGRSETI